MRNGTVSVKNVVTPTVTPDPVPGSADFQKLAMSEQIRIVDARTAARKQNRLAENAKRLQGLKLTYGP